MNSMMHWRPAGAITPSDPGQPPVVSDRQTVVVRFVPVGVTFDALLSDGRRWTLSEEMPDANGTVMYGTGASTTTDPLVSWVMLTATMPDGQVRTLRVDTDGRTSRSVAWSDFSRFTQTEKVVMGVGAALAVGGLAYAFWPRKR